MRRTLAKAGTYWVEDPEDNRDPQATAREPQRLNIELELIEDHLAQCRAFAIEWSTKQKPPMNSAITQQLVRIDLRIREKWAKLYREHKVDGKTLSKCIRECTTTADALWGDDLSKEMTYHIPKPAR